MFEDDEETWPIPEIDFYVQQKVTIILQHVIFGIAIEI